MKDPGRVSDSATGSRWPLVRPGTPEMVELTSPGAQAAAAKKKEKLSWLEY